MKVFSLFVVLCLVFPVLLATPAGAQPSMANSWSTTASHPQWVSVYNYPDGMGLPLTSAYLFGATPTNARIRLTMLDAAGMPMPGIPPADMWLESSLGGLALCPYTFPPGIWPGYVSIADGPTNAAGVTWFSNTIFGGGCSWQPGVLEHCVVMTPWGKVNGTGPGGPLNSDMFIHFNSPDMDGNGVVNLADLVLFVPCYLGGGAPYCCDFYWDGLINLSDLVIFAMGYGTACP